MAIRQIVITSATFEHSTKMGEMIADDGKTYPIDSYLEYVQIRDAIRLEGEYIITYNDGSEFTLEELIARC